MKTLYCLMFVIAILCVMPYFTHSAAALYSHGNLDLEKYSDATTTQLEFNNSIITFEQYLNKTTYKPGETIYIYGQLHNIGIHDVYVTYLGPATSSVLKDQNDKLVDSFGGAYVLDGGPYGNATLYPNTVTILRVWDFPRNVVGGGPWSLQTQPAKLTTDKPGIYYVRSMIDFHYSADMTHENSKEIILWSKPIQIIVSENQTLNQNLTKQVDLWTYDPPNNPGSVAISSDGSFVAVGTRQDDSHGSIFFLDKNGVVLWNHDLPGMVSSLNMSSDGKFLEARTKQIQNNGGTDFGYNEWDTNPYLYIFDSKGRVIFYNPDLSPTSRPISLSQDQSIIVSKNGSAVSYSNTEKTMWSYDTKSNLISVAVSPDGLFTAACTDTSLYYLDKKGELLWNQKIDNQDICPNVAASDLGYLIAGPALSNHAGNLYLFDKNGNLLWIHNDTPEYVSSNDVAMSSDGKYKVVITGQSPRNYGLSISYYGIESVPEFTLAVPVLLMGIISSIVFYRMKFRK